MSREAGMGKSRWISGLLVLIGLVIGLVISSRMDWTSTGTGDSPSEAAPASTASAPVPSDQPFIGIVEATTPAVVNIATTRVVQEAPGGQPSPFSEDPFFRRFFGDEFFRQFETPRERREQSLGSGVIVDSSGYIITNNHVVAHAEEIKVLLMDKREFIGTVVGTDAKTDLAVIKVDAKDLPTIPWGDSAGLRVGEFVLAIGNPFGLNQTVTMGIISAVGRAQVGIADYEDFIQTDAAINPGNSGGALINIRGELIGINTAIFSRSGGYMGIGFAVPSDMARSVMKNLIETGRVVRGWLGVSIQDISPDLAGQFGLKEPKGALVGDVQPGSPANKAGLEPGDVVVAYEGAAVEGSTHLRNLVAQTQTGKEVVLEIVRHKASRKIKVRIGESPDASAPSGPGESGSGNTAVLGGLEVSELTPDRAARFNIPETERGVVIVSVRPGSSAEKARLQVGDLIVEMNHKPVPGLKEFNKAASALGDDDAALLLISREGRKMFVVIKP